MLAAALPINCRCPVCILSSWASKLTRSVACTCTSVLSTCPSRAALLCCWLWSVLPLKCRPITVMQNKHSSQHLSVSISLTFGFISSSTVLDVIRCLFNYLAASSPHSFIRPQVSGIIFNCYHTFLLSSERHFLRVCTEYCCRDRQIDRQTDTYTLLTALMMQGGSGISWTLCKIIIYTSLQTDNHTSTSSLNFDRPDALPDAQPPVSNHWDWQFIDC